MDMTGRYAARLRRFYDGRKLILTGAPLAMLRGTSRMVRSLGAARPFLLAAGVGTGPLPSEEEGDRHVLQLTAPDIVSETRTIMSLLANLPAEALAALDRYDPDHEALVLSPPANELRSIAGRRVYAPRRPSWRRLEDKTLIDKLWDAHGIRRPPSEVVPATGEAMLAAARRMDQGLGTVWSGDTREGVNGGAVYVRWVRDEWDAAEAVAFFTIHCDRARVVPFIEGVPCSIHGLVLADGVAVRRPVEMITLRRRSDGDGRRARGPAAVAAQSGGGRGRAARHQVGGARGRRAGSRGPAPLRRRLDGHPPGARHQPAAAGRVQPRRLPLHGPWRAACRDAVVRAVERRRLPAAGAGPRPHPGGSAGRPAGRRRLRARRRAPGHLDRPHVIRPARALTRRSAGFELAAVDHPEVVGERVVEPGDGRHALGAGGLVVPHRCGHRGLAAGELVDHLGLLDERPAHLHGPRDGGVGARHRAGALRGGVHAAGLRRHRP